MRFIWAGLGAILFVGALASWLRVRGRAETIASARVRLEDALGLKSRLSTAASGVGDWPQPHAEIAHPVKLRWHQPLLVCAFTAAMLLLAARIPISKTFLQQKHVIEKPPAAAVVQKWLDQLREKKAAEDQKAKVILSGELFNFSEVLLHNRPGLLIEAPFLPL